VSVSPRRSVVPARPGSDAPAPGIVPGAAAAGFGRTASLRPVTRPPSRPRQALDFLARPARRVAYGPDRSQRADLYLPRGKGPFAVVVLIHGGYWQSRYSKRLMRLQAADLVRRGFAAWNIEYRRIGIGGGWPETFDDVAAAIDLLASLDAPLDLGAGVSAVGHSAGGQLAMWAASRGALPAGAPGAAPAVELSRVVSQAGVLAMARTAEANQGGAVCHLLGGMPGEHPDRYDLADPMRRIPLGVPALLVHGDADATVPIKRSRDYFEAAREAGADVSLVEIPGGGHRSHIDTRTKDWTTVANWLGSAS
jgi:acetyl esterase/lipase